MKPVTGVMRQMVDEDYLIPVTGDGDEEEASESTQAAGAVLVKGTQTETTSDEVHEDKPDFSEALRKYQDDINKMKSSFQKKETELVKEKSALEKKLDELLKSTMDEGDRKQYEQDKLREELEQLRAERNQLAMERDQVGQFMVWKEFFADAGVPNSELDVSNGVEGLFGSGMAAMKKRIKAMEAASKPQASADVPLKKAKTPPEVAQSTTGKVSSVGTLSEAIKHFAGGNEEKFWRMAETGNENVLKVLNELNSQ